MRTFISYINNLVIPLIPETKGFGVKRLLWRMAGAKIGKNVKISSSCKILGAGELSIGDNTWIGYQVMFVTSSSIEIGMNVDIAPRVYIGTGTHTINADSSRVASTDVSEDVCIGNGTWICANATILPGSVVGQNCVVAAGAVVKGEYKARTLIGGVPSRMIKSL